MPALKHLIAIGQQFGRLTVLRQVASAGRRRRFLCRCVCGTETTVGVDHLVSGDSTSCGCYNRERVRECYVPHPKHGHAVGNRQTPEYRVWAGMKARCLNPNKPAFKDYGGRGIRICDRWRDSFEAFYADMGPRPSLQHELDRYPDNDGHYEPGNVRWATRAQQMLNTRQNRFLTYAGRTQTVVEWAREIGIPASRLRDRLRLGWTVDRALSSH